MTQGTNLEQENQQTSLTDNCWRLPGWQQPTALSGGYSMLTLAYVGDAVYELLVRQHIVSGDMAKVKQMHQRTIQLVCAETQAALALAIEPSLTAEERDILRRGRNAKGGHLPKSTTAPTYRLATGLEALIGYLYLQQRLERLEKIFSLLWQWEGAGQIPATQNKDKPCEKPGVIEEEA